MEGRITSSPQSLFLFLPTFPSSVSATLARCVRLLVGWGSIQSWSGGCFFPLEVLRRLAPMCSDLPMILKTVTRYRKFSPMVSVIRLCIPLSTITSALPPISLVHVRRTYLKVVFADTREPAYFSYCLRPLITRPVITAPSL